MSYMEAMSQAPQDDQGAAEEQKPVTSLVPDEAGMFRDYMRKGEDLFREGHYHKAMEEFRMASVLSPNVPESLLSQFHARFATSRRSYASAAHFLSRTLKVLPELPLVPLAPKEFYDDPAAYAGQVASLQKHCTKVPADSEALLVLAYFRWFEGQTDKATEALTQAKAAGPGKTSREAIETFWDGIVASGKVPSDVEPADEKEKSGESPDQPAESPQAPVEADD